MNNTTGTVVIGSHKFVLPENDARELFMAAMLTRSKGKALAVTADLMIAIGANTTLTLAIADGFHDELTPAQWLAQATRHRRAVMI